MRIRTELTGHNGRYLNKAVPPPVEPPVSDPGDQLLFLVTLLARSTQSPWVRAVLCWALIPSHEQPHSPPTAAIPTDKTTWSTPKSGCASSPTYWSGVPLAPKSRQVPVCVPSIASQLRTSISPTGCVWARRRQRSDGGADALFHGMSVRCVSEGDKPNPWSVPGVSNH
jgi:hypothetical protein